MNRKARRAKQKINRKAKMKIWPFGYVGIPNDDTLKISVINDGDIFTVSGHGTTKYVVNSKRSLT